MIGMALWIEATELYLNKGDFYVSIKICNNKCYSKTITLAIGHRLCNSSFVIYKLFLLTSSAVTFITFTIIIY